MYSSACSKDYRQNVKEPLFTGMGEPWGLPWSPQTSSSKEVSGHRDLFKSVPENWGLSACGTTHEATLGVLTWAVGWMLRSQRKEPAASGLRSLPLGTAQGCRKLSHPGKGHRG